VSDVYQLSLPNVHGKPPPALERESLTFTAGPLSIQGDVVSLIVAGRSDGGISFWRSKERRIKFTNSVHKENMLQSRGGVHNGPVTALGYCSDPSVTCGRTGLLFSGSSDRTIKVVNLNFFFVSIVCASCLC
jgi:WD40 repeat protein